NGWKEWKTKHGQTLDDYVGRDNGISEPRNQE
ncbi:MAG: endonuclease, partial [Idiomarina sp.]|nr:endonuclease [Idiomarina sp.]